MAEFRRCFQGVKGKSLWQALLVLFIASCVNGLPSRLPTKGANYTACNEDNRLSGNKRNCSSDVSSLSFTFFYSLAI